MTTIEERKCKSCNGYGEVGRDNEDGSVSMFKCLKCNGTGYVTPSETIPNAEESGDTKLSMSSLEERVRQLLQKYFDKYQPYDGEDDQTVEAILSLITDEKIAELERYDTKKEICRNCMLPEYINRRIDELKDQRRGE